MKFKWCYISETRQLQLISADNSIIASIVFSEPVQFIYESHFKTTCEASFSIENKQVINRFEGLLGQALALWFRDAYEKVCYTKNSAGTIFVRKGVEDKNLQGTVRISEQKEYKKTLYFKIATTNRSGIDFIKELRSIFTSMSLKEAKEIYDSGNTEYFIKFQKEYYESKTLIELKSIALSSMNVKFELREV